MKYNYAWEKFHQAVMSLVGPAPQKNRLKTAVLTFLVMRRSGPDPIPPGIRPDFDELLSKLQCGEPSGDESVWDAAIDQMTEEEVSECVEAIVSMYDDVCRHQEPLE